MKKGLLTAFGICVLLAEGALGQSNQSYTVSLPGGGNGNYYLIANQLDHGSNTLDEVLPNMPDGTTLLKWNCALQDFDPVTPVFSAFTGHWSPSATLVPGEGAFIVPAGPLASITFTGRPHVPVLPVPLPCGFGAATILSRQTNDVATFENITGVAPADGAQVWLWDPTIQDYVHHAFNCGAWSPALRSVAVGEAALIAVAAPSLCHPVITCATNKTGCGASWSFDTPIAVNPCTGKSVSVTNLNTTTNSMNPLTVTRTWLAYDTCGNTATCSQTVTLPPLLLSFSVVSNNVVITWDGECCVVLEEAEQVTGPWQIVFDALSYYPLSRTAPARFYRLRGGSLTSNSAFTEGNSPGPMPSPGHADGWFAAYGNPEVYNLPGCADNGFIRLSGNRQNGQAVAQTLVPAHRIQAGHNYQLSFCARYVPGDPGPSYPQIRAWAFNGLFPPGPGHPLPSADLAIIDVSAPINFTEWTHVILSCWKANQDFDSIAFNAQNETNTSSAVDIDNICLLEVLGTCPCDEAAVDAEGNPLMPDNIDPDVPPTFTDVDQYNGKVTDLYGQFYDTSTAMWYPTNDPCVSIGGTVPEAALNVDMDLIFQTNGLPLTPADLTNYLAMGTSNAMTWATNQLSVYPFDLPFWAGVTPIPPYTNQGSTTLATNLEMIFCGQDIVFVHGYRTTPLLAAVLHSSTKPYDVWPGSHDEFYNNYQGNGYYGYWKQGADDYWKDHIEHYLTSRGKKNRYLIVSHAVTQGMQVGAAAVLTQIADAMNTGQGVVFDPADPRGSDGFGAHGFVIVSHSDGGLQIDIAMTIADQSRNQAGLFYQFYGDASYIADHATAHVALQGAFSGSTVALVLYTITTVTTARAPLGVMFAMLYPLFTGADWNSGTLAILNGETRDMTPQVAQGFWGPLCVSQMPVKTVTIAGGHPSGFGVDTLAAPAPINFGANLVKLSLLKGFDDGVLNMDCQTANPNPTFFGPSVYMPIPFPFHANVYDMGISRSDFSRAVGYYLDQTYRLNLVNIGVAAGAIPSLSPAGMVQPVAFNLQPSAYNRYPNHYSFLMTASDHFWGPIGHEGDPTSFFTPPFNYEPTYYSHPAKSYDDNSEECFVVTDSRIYQPINNPYASPSCPFRLVDPAVAGIVEETIKGRKIGWSFKIFHHRYSRYFWIWKRKYHRLQGFDSMSECDYMYDYVLH